MGNSLALYNPPTRVAEEFAMIDCISGGRLIAGFPVGTPMDTCYAYGQNPRQLRERYLEAHDLVMRAWTEQDTFAFNGRYNQQRYVNIWPRPVQQPHPPIWIPGGGSVETWQWCAEMDYVYCYLSYYGYKAGQATMDGFWDEMARLGKDRNPYRAGFLQFVGVGESREQAYRPVQRGRRVFLRPLPARRSALRHARPATRPKRRSARGMQSQVQQAAAPARRPHRHASRGARDGRHRRPRLRDHRLARTRWRSSCAKWRASLNVGHLMLLLQFGNMSKDLTPLQHEAVRRAGDAEAEGRCSPSGKTAGGRSRSARRSAPRCPPSCRSWRRNRRRPRRIPGRRRGPVLFLAVPFVPDLWRAG